MVDIRTKRDAGCPVLKGSASAEEDSRGRHQEEWMLFHTIVLSCRVLARNDY